MGLWQMGLVGPYFASTLALRPAAWPWSPPRIPMVQGYELVELPLGIRFNPYAYPVLVTHSSCGAMLV
ncbi:MAG TPA: hypothetical protein DHW22_13640 [Planctomycetaceae bacterium]|nr:hypothetical protein [Planctomycetaceae bacterium]